MTKSPELISTRQRLGWDDNVGLVAQNSQLITDDFLVKLSDKRAESTRKREGEFMHVASIPVIFVDKWKREGFDVFASGVTAKQIVKRLRAENLEAFLATNKRVD